MLSLGTLTMMKLAAAGQPAVLIETVSDITARKQAEETVQRTNQEFEELAANHRALLGQLFSIREEESGPRCRARFTTS